jgi:hypothetical protein
MDRDLIQALVLILVLGLAVLALRRGYDEGFIGGGGATPCGVNMAPCSDGLKCVNGFCASTQPVRAYERAPVGVLPDGEGAALPLF